MSHLVLICLTQNVRINLQCHLIQHQWIKRRHYLTKRMTITQVSTLDRSRQNTKHHTCPFLQYRRQYQQTRGQSMRPCLCNEIRKVTQFFRYLVKLFQSKMRVQSQAKKNSYQSLVDATLPRLNLGGINSMLISSSISK